MPIIFSDEDLMYHDKEHDDQLRSIRQAIDTMKDGKERLEMVRGLILQLNNYTRPDRNQTPAAAEIMSIVQDAVSSAPS